MWIEEFSYITDEQFSKIKSRSVLSVDDDTELEIKIKNKIIYIKELKCKNKQKN